MDTIVKVLVLDDHPLAAKESIDSSLRPIAVEANLRGDNEPCSWRVAVKDLTFTVECTFADKLVVARNLLLDKTETNSYHLILLDNDWEAGGGRPGGLDGLRLLEELSKVGFQHPYLAIYTQAQSYRQEYVSAALGFGARALIYKSEPTHFLNVLFGAASYARQKQEITELSERVGNLWERQEQFVNALVHVDPRLTTKSQTMKDCLVDAARYAITPDIPVILTGPTGSGKEVLARAMHKISPRRDRMFDVLDCTTVTKDLAESLLFGHEKGSFTGAHAPRPGIFEIANGGTLMIDEVDALSLDLQAKLLRVTEYGEYKRVGGHKTLSSDCRLIVTTNKDLLQLVEKGSFREDLYARLNIGAIRIPSLNERQEDIQDLALYFLEEFSERNKQTNITLTDDAKLGLQNHDWRFNIRELRATMFRSAMKRSSDVLGFEGIVFDKAFDAGVVEATAGQSSAALSYGVLMEIIENAPRQGSQRRILDLLLEKYPEWVSYEELHKAIEQSADEEKASGGLMTSISRLKKSLEKYIRIENDQGRKSYRIAQVSPD